LQLTSQYVVGRQEREILLQAEGLQDSGIDPQRDRWVAQLHSVQRLEKLVTVTDFGRRSRRASGDREIGNCHEFSTGLT
jgi:hypothetical protein